MKLKLPHTTHKNNSNSKCPKDLNIRHDTIKLLEENIGKTFSDVNPSDILLNQSPTAKEIKTKVNKWDLLKLRNFCTAKEVIDKRQPVDWQKILANDMTNRGLISKIYKHFIQHNIKTQTTQSKGE